MIVSADAGRGRDPARRRAPRSARAGAPHARSSASRSRAAARLALARRVRSSRAPAHAGRSATSPRATSGDRRARPLDERRPTRYRRIARVLRTVVEADQPIGRRHFSDIAYELLPPGTRGERAAPVAPLLRSRRAPGSSRRAPTPTGAGFGLLESPWSARLPRRHAHLAPACASRARSSSATGIAPAPCCCQRPRRLAVRPRPTLTQEASAYEQAGIELRVVPLFPGDDDRRFFSQALGPGAFVSTPSCSATRSARGAALARGRLPAPPARARASALLGLLGAERARVRPARLAATACGGRRVRRRGSLAGGASRSCSRSLLAWLALDVRRWHESVERGDRRFQVAPGADELWEPTGRLLPGGSRAQRARARRRPAPARGGAALPPQPAARRRAAHGRRPRRGDGRPGRLRRVAAGRGRRRARCARSPRTRSAHRVRRRDLETPTRRRRARRRRCRSTSRRSGSTPRTRTRWRISSCCSRCCAPTTRASTRRASDVRGGGSGGGRGLELGRQRLLTRTSSSIRSPGLVGTRGRRRRSAPSGSSGARGGRVRGVLGLAPPPRRSGVLAVVAIAPSPCSSASRARSRSVVGSEPRQVRTDAEVYFVFDITRSMLASAGAGEPTRLARARRFARRVRAAVPDVPAGIASFTNRVVPHVFPTPSLALFSSGARPLARDRAAAPDRSEAARS